MQFLRQLAEAALSIFVCIWSGNAIVGPLVDNFVKTFLHH